MNVAGVTQATATFGEALAGRPLIESTYEEALEKRYLWHEFGDLHLILP